MIIIVNSKLRNKLRIYKNEIKKDKENYYEERNEKKRQRTGNDEAIEILNNNTYGVLSTASENSIPRKRIHSKGK